MYRTYYRQNGETDFASYKVPQFIKVVFDKFSRKKNYLFNFVINYVLLARSFINVCKFNICKKFNVAVICMTSLSERILNEE